MPKKIVISGYYGFGNTGDEAVLAGILTTFKKIGLDARVTVLSANPEHTKAEHAGIESVHRYKIAGLIKAISSADLVISGGGSLFQDVTSARSVRYYLFVLQIAQLLKRKTMIYAQGVGPLNADSTRKAVAKTLSKVDLITVRDAESKLLLESIGVKKPQIHLSADPALVVEPDLAAADRIISSSGISGNEMIGVSLRPWHGAEGQLAAAARGISEACEELGVKPALIPMQEAEDIDVNEAIAGGVLLRGAGSPAVVKGLISRCGLVVGMRLHALILAAGESVPFVSLSYDPKVSSFATAAGCGDTLDICSITSEQIKNAVISAWNDRNTTAQPISQKASELMNMALESGRLAAALLV